ncbi:hypothetical protein FACS189421_13030 [Bacteroidia bacterium]|nr:hypothetical protein FACS189421_13030 [Bacteroidia bacterium]
MIKYILFDVANTLIHKPLLWDKLQETLAENGFVVSKDKIKTHHKIISEQIDFPDRTDSKFYATFNANLLISLGIYPDENLLNSIFKKCSYLPWEPFSDTSFLETITLPIGILSNFRKELPELLENIFNYRFSDIIVSEEEHLKKPDVRFFEFAIKKTGLLPEEILYVGDSLKLDYLPARKMNMSALLIDRIGAYCSTDYTISDLNRLNKWIQ